MRFLFVGLVGVVVGVLVFSGRVEATGGSDLVGEVRLLREELRVLNGSLRDLGVSVRGVRDSVRSMGRDGVRVRD